MIKKIRNITLGSIVVAIPIIATVSCGTNKLTKLESKMNKQAFRKVSYSEREKIINETFYSWYGSQTTYEYYKPFAFMFQKQTAAAGINTPKPIPGDYIGDVYIKEGSIRMEVVEDTQEHLTTKNKSIVKLRRGDIIEFSNFFSINEIFDWDKKNKHFKQKDDLFLFDITNKYASKIKIKIYNHDLIQNKLMQEINYYFMSEYNEGLLSPETITSFNLYEYSKEKFNYKEGIWK